MTERRQQRDAFLARAGWGDAIRTHLAGDASNRQYERLRRPDSGATAILMDSPPDQGEDIRPFVRIGTHFHALGLSAPAFLAEDDENGFLLLEDLGDDLFTRVIERAPGMERALYEAATDLLVALQSHEPPALTHLAPDLLAEMTGPAFDHYVAAIAGDPAAEARATFQARFEDILRQTIKGRPVLAHRDYHAENLVWLPERAGVQRVGLLDFQDAVLAHPAYDLVSLLQDARRDVRAQTEAAMIARFIEQSGLDDHALRIAYVVLGAQRNLRILGIFARLVRQRGKPRYADLIPRVWDHLMRNLDHPAMAPVSQLLVATLPPPTPANLRTLLAPT